MYDIITQQDRDAGADYWAGLGQNGSAEQCRTGKGFRYTALAFAKYRISLQQNS